MKQVPDAIRRRLFPGERVVWFGKSRATRVFLYFAGHIAAAIGWFGFSYFVERDLVFGLGLPILVTYLLLLLVSTDYVLTDSRVIAISPILPPRVLYLNLINDLGAPVPIKFGWIDGIRFGEFLVRQEDRYKYFWGGRLSSLSFRALEDHKTVYDLALSAQHAAGRLWFARR